MSSVVLTDLPVVASLRYLLSLFRLPGESQEIERIMEAYSESFFKQQREGPEPNSR